MNDIILSNNRFLGKTNPTMAAAAADGGSVLDREYIQRAARGIVDAGHWSNLKYWGVAGLAKLRNSGGVDYVPKLYDLSGEGNDGVQTTEGSQPVWGATGLDFDGSDDFLDCGNDSSLRIRNNLTVCFWIKNDTGNFTKFALGRFNSSTTKRAWLVLYGGTTTNTLRVNVYANDAGTTLKSYSTTNAMNDGNWHFVSFTFADNVLKYYVDGSELTGGDLTKLTDNTVDLLTDSDVSLYFANPTANFAGNINDLRIYNTALTATEIAAIYNQTSYRYA